MKKYLLALFVALGCVSCGFAVQFTEIVDMADLIGNATLGTGVTQDTTTYATADTVYDFTGEGAILNLKNETLAGYIEGMANGAATPGSGFLTIAAWIKPSSDDEISIFSTGGQSDGFKFGLKSRKPLITTKNIKDVYDINVALPKDQWTFVANTFALDGTSQGRFYKTTSNDYYTRSFGKINACGENDRDFAIGSGNASDNRNCFKGFIANLTVLYSTSGLTTENAEIAAFSRQPQLPIIKNNATEHTYASLQEALADAVDGATVTLLADATSAGNLTVDTVKAVTVDLNGKTMKVTGTLAGAANLTVSGSGMLDLTGAALDTYTGRITVASDATLRVAKGDESHVTRANDGTLQIVLPFAETLIENTPANGFAIQSGTVGTITWGYMDGDTFKSSGAETMDGSYTPNVNTWTAANKEGNWSDPARWSHQALPTTGETLEISITGDTTLYLTESVTVENLLVRGDGSALTIAAAEDAEGTPSLTVSGILEAQTPVGITAKVGTINHFVVLGGAMLNVAQDDTTTINLLEVRGEAVAIDEDVDLPEGTTGVMSSPLVKNGAGMLILSPSEAYDHVVMENAQLQVVAGTVEFKANALVNNATLTVTGGKVTYPSVMTVKGGTVGDCVLKTNTNPTDTTFTVEGDDTLKVVYKTVEDDGVDADGLYIEKKTWAEAGMAVADTSWSNETDAADGSAEKPFVITTPEQLAGLAKLVNEGISFAGKTITLGNNIDLGGVAWPGIGIYNESAVGNAAFQGTFNGNSHTITGVSFGASYSGLKYRGFFNQIYKATVKNVTVEVKGFEEGTTGSFGGAVLVGHAWSSTLASCVTEGALNVTHNAAGLVVRISSDKGFGCVIRNCTNKANLESNYTKIGGIAAFSQTNYATPVIENCVNEGAITSTTAMFDGNYADMTSGRVDGGIGGIIGWVGYGGSNPSITIKDCSNTGAITATSAEKTPVGQIAGQIWTNYIIDGTNTGCVDTLAVDHSPVDGLNYATVTEVEGRKVATYIKGEGLVPGETTYLVTASNDYGNWIKPVVALGINESITFDISLAAIDASGITAVTGVSVEDNGTTVTYKANPVTNWLQVANTDWFTDDTDVYTLTQPEQLAGLAKLVNEGTTFAGQEIVLDGDIDLSGATYGTTGVVWSGIGVHSKDRGQGIAFKGVFNGNNKKITGMTFADGKYQGFFNQIDGATVKDLTIQGDITITGGGAYFVGSAHGATIENCVAEGNFVATHNVAGIVTYLASDSILRNCKNKANLSNSDDKIGGIACIVEKCTSQTRALIENCVNEGTLTASQTGSGENGVGGILGYLAYEGVSGGYAIIKNCTNKGTINKADGNTIAKIGQIIGRDYGGYVTLEGNKGLDATLALGHKSQEKDTASGGHDGLNYATVENGVATYVKNSELAVGNTYLVTAQKITPSITLNGGESITFDATLAEYNADGIQAASVLMEPKVNDKKTTYTAALVMVGEQGFTTLDDALTAVAEAADKTVTIYGNVEWRDGFTLAEDVTIKLAEGVTGVKAPVGYEWSEDLKMTKFKPSGSIAQAIVNMNKPEIANGTWQTIYCEAWVCAQQSMVVKLYSGETLLGTTELVDTAKVLLNGNSNTVTWHFFLAGSDDWWKTEWVVNPLLANVVPDKVELYCDGEKVAENTVYLSNSNDNMGAATVLYNWGDLENVMVAKIDTEGEDGETETTYYDTLQDAIDAANGATITLLGNTKINIDEENAETGKDFVLDLNDNTVEGFFFLKGQVTIKNGRIDCSNLFKSGIESGTGAKVTVEDLEIVSQRHAIRVDGGELVVNSGTYTTIGRIGVDDTSHAINVGTSKPGEGYVAKVTINGGTFNGLGASEVVETVDSSCAVAAQAGADITIHGGTFNGKNRETLGNNYGGTYTLYGGTYDQDPRVTGAILPTGYIVIPQADGTFTVEKFTNWIQVADTSWYDANDPKDSYTIDSEEELAGLAKLVNGGTSFAGVELTLTKDLDLSGATYGEGISNIGWLGIGVYSKTDMSKAFKGVFNGGAFRISGMTFADMGTADDANNYRGFFNQIYNATIKNLTVSGNIWADGSTPASGEYGGALIVGHARSSNIEDCVSDGSVNGTHNVGGIVVRFSVDTEDNYYIKGCTNKANLTTTYTKAGGIVALSQSITAPYTIEGCVNEGSVNSTYTGSDHGGFGGIIGWVGYTGDGTPTEDPVTIKNCENKAAVTGPTGKTGQIAGSIWTNYTIEGTNTGLVDTFAVDHQAVSGLSYALVTEDGIATYVKTLEAGNTYLVTAPNPKPVIELAAGESIAFDASLTTYDASGITAASELMPAEIEGNVTTYTAAAAKIGETLYASLQAAIDKATTGDTVLVLGDLFLGTTCADHVVVDGKTLIIDLNSFTVTGSGCDGVIQATNGANVTVKDSVGSGKVIAYACEHQYAMAVWSKGATVTIEGGTYAQDGTKDAEGNLLDTQYDLIYASASGTVNVAGGTFKSDTPQWTLNAKDNDGAITVSGGSFYEYNPYATTTEPGGTTNLCPEGWYGVQDENGYYTLAEITNWIQIANTAWYVGTETTFTLTTAEQLAGLAKLVNEGNNFAGVTITLGADIDLDAYAWTPIALGQARFCGVFDGGQNTIANLKCEYTDSTQGIGLFGNVGDNSTVVSGAVKNIKVVNPTVTGGSYSVAVVCARLRYGTIENCDVSGNVSVIGGAGTGVIVGLSTVPSEKTNAITDCDVSGNVTLHSVQGWAGGIVGQATRTIIDGCNVIGTAVAPVTMTIGENAGSIGGIMGNDAEGVTIKNCSVNYVKLTGERVGGISGLSNALTVFMCSAQNLDLTGVGNLDLVGSIAGANNSASGGISKLYNNTTDSEIPQLALYTTAGEVNNSAFVGTGVVFDETNKVKSGTFTVFDEAKASTILASRAFATDNGDGTYTVFMAVASVGDKGYTTLQAAINAAIDANGGTVKVLIDTTEAVRIEKVEATQAKARGLMLLSSEETTTPAVTLDLNGYTVAKVTVPAGANLTIEDSNAAAGTGKIGELVVESGAQVKKAATVDETDAQAPTGYTWVDHVLTANKQTFTVTTIGSGEVTGVPEGTVDFGTTFDLTAVPATGFVFAGWSGDFATVNATVAVEVQGDVNLTATFIPEAVYDTMTNQVIENYKDTNELVSKKDIVDLSVQYPTIEVTETDDGSKIAKVGIQLMKAESLEKDDQGKIQWSPLGYNDIGFDTEDSTVIKAVLPAEGTQRFFRFIPVNGLAPESEQQ